MPSAWHPIGQFDGLALAVYPGREGPVVLTCARTERGRDLRVERYDRQQNALSSIVLDLGLNVSVVAASDDGTVCVLGDKRGVQTPERGYLVLNLEASVSQASGGSITGGHIGGGVTAPSPTWYFAEGYTGSGFDEYLTILNPDPEGAMVSVTYYREGEGPVVKSHLVPAASRYTIKVNDEVGPGQAVSAKVESDRPIVAERPMYFRYGG